MVKYYSLLPTRKITKILSPCCNPKRRKSSTFHDADQKPHRKYRVSKSWSILFIPFFITYMVFYNYRYQSNWNFPKEHHTDKQIISTVDVMVHDEVKKTTTMRLLSLDDLDLKRKDMPIEETPFIVTNYDYPKEFVSSANKPTKSSIIGRDRTCSYNHTGLGRVSINTTILSLEWVDRQYPVVSHGGYYKPPYCRPRHKVAILVPYMNRPENLASFLFNIHPFLINQKIEYRIFVIEQSGQHTPFNKGRLYNAGFSEAQKLSRWKCFIFHEVDLLPLDSRVLYSCPTWPRQMSATILTKDPSRRTLFGGVTSLTPEQFIKVNGYSNYRYLGEEDSDMFWRLRLAGFSISRYNKSIAQYTELPHKPAKNPFRLHLAGFTISRYNKSIAQYTELPHKPAKNPFGSRRTPRPSHNKKKEGLSELNYTTIKIEAHHLYTSILVDVNRMREKPGSPKRKKISSRK